MVICFKAPRLKQQEKQEQLQGSSKQVNCFLAEGEKKKSGDKKCRNLEDEEDQVSCREAACSCLGGLTGICCAACCCCPLTILPLAGFVCIKVPSSLVRRLKKKKKSALKLSSSRSGSMKFWRSSSSDHKQWPDCSLALEKFRYLDVGFGNSSDWKEFFEGGSWRMESCTQEP